MKSPRAALSLLALIFVFGLRTRAENLGVFTDHADIGKVSKTGSVSFTNNSYLISGGGENMWFTNDAFHFVWKKLSGDFSLSAAIDWIGSAGNAHRKACLLVRQSLEPGSPYVDVAVHGDGLVSLQFRESVEGMTREVQIGQRKYAQVGIERQGDAFFMTADASARKKPTEAGADNGANLQPTGAFIRIRLTDPVYVGLGVCAHDDKVLEKAEFSRVSLQSTEPNAADKPILHSTLETVAIASKDRRAIYHTLDHIEAPNWSRDGTYFLFNTRGHIYRLPIAGGAPEPIDTGSANRCNNDHGLSPDGTLLAISDQSVGSKSLISILPTNGGTPRQITPVGPSYWHGWSPDGKTLAYCAQRDGEFDIYTVPTTGGEEVRLTTAKGLDDGPDYSPDGKFIYFNSERTGSMQIWRMLPDGTQQEPVTSDEFNNWFPHPSPDGKWLVFLSYNRSVVGHPENQLVKLRIMPLAGGLIQDLARLFGGQGTINVSSWSPDSKQVAFVSYELLRPSVAKER
jgi:hypothetical protein